MRHQFRFAAVAIAIAALAAVAIAPGLARGQDKHATVMVDGPSNVSASAQEVVFDVKVKDADNLGGFQFVLSFDSALLRPVSVNKTDFLATTGREIACQDPTIQTTAVLLTCVTLRTTPAGVDGSGTLAVVTLKPQKDGVSPVRLSHVKLVHPDGSELPSQTVDGNLTVGGSSGSWFNWWRIVLIAAGAVIVVVAAAVLWRRSRRVVHHEPHDFGSDAV